MISLTAKQLDDLWETRCGLEALAARVACQYITGNDLNALLKLCDVRDAAARNESIEIIRQNDLEYHQLVIKLSRNKILLEIFHSRPLLEVSCAMDPGTRQICEIEEASPYGHRAIIRAIAERKDALAEQLMAQHLRAAKARAMHQLRQRNGNAHDSNGKHTRADSFGL
jgi:DNA-binding GntR family transcriptional regulator